MISKINRVQSALGSQYVISIPNQVDPTVVAVEAPAGVVGIRKVGLAGNLPELYQKQDDGLTTNWLKIGMAVDQLVKVSADDTTANFLLAKLAATPGVLINELNPGGNEQAQIGSEKAIFMQPDFGGNQLNYRIRNLGGNGNFNFNIRAPFDFVTLISCQAIFFNRSASNDGNLIDIESNYGALGEQADNTIESDTLNVTFSTFPVERLGALDLSSILTSLAAGDFVGINIDHNGLGGSLDYIGLLLRYTNI